MSEDTAQKETTNQPPTGWQYKPDQPSGGVGNTPETPRQDAAAAPQLPKQELTWTASEFIAHHKGAGWYGSVVVVGSALTAVVFFLTHDRISTAMVIIVVVLFCIAAARKPRVLTYSLTPDGLSIGQRFYSYGEFRSFSVEREGAFANIELLPMQRFSPLTSLYCSPDTEDNIIGMLSAYIPLEERSKSYVDRFMRNIRF